MAQSKSKTTGGFKRHFGGFVRKVWPGLAVAAITAAVKPARNFAWDFLKWIAQGIAAMWRHLGSASAMPWWLVYVAIGLLVWAGWAALRRWWVSSASPTARDPVLGFTECTALGLRWRWEYGDQHYAYNIRPFCISCDFESPLRQGPFRTLQIVCPKCGPSGESMDIDLDQFDSLARREIERRIRLMERELATRT